MGVEPLVLGADESVPHVLGNGGDVHRNTLGLVADLVDRNPLVILVLGVDIRVVGQLHFFDGDVGNIIPEMHDIDHQRRCHDGACDDENEEDSTVYQLKYQPTKLDIELKYDELILEEGDSFCVRVYDDSGKNVTVKESSDTLKVRSTKKLSKTRKVHISYPEDVKLQELEIEMGAGTVYLNRDIETEKLSVEMGAGEFESKNPVTAMEADLEIGTGSMTFADLSARKTDGECGLGELDLTLTGTQEDYNYDLECGVGNLDVGSDSYSGLGREKTISNKGADRKLDLECGMGNVSVDFSGKEHRDLQMS